jgi:hypothetical protein
MLVLLLLALACVPLCAEVRVWAVSDGVRVNPVTGGLLEARPDIHADYPAGDFRIHNLVWDSRPAPSRSKPPGTSSPYSSHVESPEPVDDVDVTVTPLRHIGGAEIGGVTRSSKRVRPAPGVHRLRTLAGRGLVS